MLNSDNLLFFESDLDGRYFLVFGPCTQPNYNPNPICEFSLGGVFEV